VIERLLGKSYDLPIYDKKVNVASSAAANRDFILNRIPHISRLIVDCLDTVLEHAEVIVIGTEDPDFQDIMRRLRDGQTTVDFVRVKGRGSSADDYEGICW
jgi:GDP-mannose 6-dehydrogenase